MKKKPQRLNGDQIEALKSAPLGTSANRLSIAFALANVRQSVACDATDLSASDISKLIHGDYKSLDVEKARKLALFFNCSIEDLFPAKQEVA